MARPPVRIAKCVFALLSLAAMWSAHTNVPLLLTVPTTLSLICWELLLIGVRKRRRLLAVGGAAFALVPVLTVASLVCGSWTREKSELRSQYLAGRSAGLGQALLGIVPEADLVSSGSKVSALAGLFPRKRMRGVRERLLADYDQMQRTPGFDGIGNVAATSALSGRPRHYFVYVPKHIVVGPDTPVLLCLHGAGGNFALYVWWWRELAISRQCILVCPSYDNGAWWQQPGTEFALAVLDEVRRQYGCEKGPVFLLGLSNGAVGTWSVAASRPGLFSGICCISGAHERDRDLQACRGIPSLLIHGAADRMIPIDLARQTAAYLENAGADTALVEIPDADHFVLAKERSALFGRINQWMDSLLSRGPTSPSMPNVVVHRRWETAVPLDMREANPFAPEHISVVGAFEHSSGKQYTVPGFWYQDYDYAVDRVARIERLTPTGDPSFRVRFSPPIEGWYAYHFEVTTSAGTKTIPGGTIQAKLSLLTFSVCVLLALLVRAVGS